MSFTVDGSRRFLVVTATRERRESKGFFFRNKSIPIRSIRLLDSCGITMKLSAPRAELLEWHFIDHGCAPAACYAACSLHSPRSDCGSLPLRLGLSSALGNCATPKLRRSGHIEVAAHRAKASSSSADASTCDGCRDRAPRIEAAPRDELSDSDEPLILKLMRHNDCDQRPPANLHRAPRVQNISLRPRRAPHALSRPAASRC